MKKRFLCIDDDPISRFIFSRVFKQENIVLLEAANGEMGLKIIDILTEEFVFVFLDLNMPIMDGYEFIKKVNENKAYQHVRIFIFSALEPGMFFQNCLEKDLDISKIIGFVEKPITVLTKDKIFSVVETVT